MKEINNSYGIVKLNTNSQVVLHSLKYENVAGRFRYLQLKALGTQICNLMEVQAWVGNVNIAAVTNGAAAAEWRDPENLTLSQESMSWTYSGNDHYASLANNNILGTEPGVHTSYPFAHSASGNITLVC